MSVQRHVTLTTDGTSVGTHVYWRFRATSDHYLDSRF